MNDNLEKNAVALLCDKMGIVREVLKDDLHRFDDYPLNRPLTAFMHPTSLPKVRHFLQEILDNGIALDWELLLPQHKKKVDLLRFTGILHDRQIIVAGAVDLPSVMSLYEQILSMHSDQITMLREEVKRRKELVEQFQRVSLLGYEEVTRLNNELVTMQRDLVKKARELEALNQQKNVFLGVAAHDLRNPIGNILSLSEILQDELKAVLNEENNKFFSLIDNSCRFMLRLISDLLDYSQIESGKLKLEQQAVDLDIIALAQVDAFKKAAQDKDLKLVLTRQENGPFTVRGDSGRLSQVVDNLVSNAIKFSKGPNRVQVMLRLEPGTVLLTVQDHGVGISRDEQGRLFEPFAKASARPTSGERSTGLGLSIVKRIVEAHGGIVEMESEPGQGTTMTVRLPAL